MFQVNLSIHVVPYEENRRKEKSSEKSLRTGNMRDMEDLITTLHQLGELKLEKAMPTDDSSVWNDLMATYERVLQLKQDKLMRAFNTKDIVDSLLDDS